MSKDLTEYLAACAEAWGDGRRNSVESAIGQLETVSVADAVEQYVAKLIKNRERKRGANPSGRNSHSANTRLVLLKLMRELGINHLHELTALRVTAYMDSSPLTAKTLRGHKSCLDGLCTFARTKGWLSSDPLELLESPALPPTTIRWIKLDDFPRVLEAVAGNGCELPIALAGLAAIRRCEIIRLAPSDVLWQDRHIRIRAEVSKTGRERKVPMSPLLQELVERHGQRFGPALCASPRKRTTWLPSSLTNASKRALRKSGIVTEPDGLPLVKSGIFNTLRHGAITYWLDGSKEVKPKDPWKVAAWSGNSVLVIEKHYGAHIVRPEDADAADFLKAHHA